MDRLTRKYDKLQFEVDNLSSKLRDQLAVNAVIARDLRTSAEKILVSQRLISEDIELVNEEHAAAQKQRKIDVKNVTSAVEAVENHLTELDSYIADKLDQQLAIDSSAAAEFHSFAHEKYRLLEIASSKQQDSLAQIAAGQEELAARITALLSDQVELRNRLDKVEDEQMECSCSELRMMIARSAADRITFEEERDELLNEQEKLRRKLAEDEAAPKVEEQRAVISESLESREEIVVAVLTALAKALNLELRLEDVDEKPEAKSTCPVSSVRLAKALLSEMQVLKEESSPEISPYYMHDVIAVVALVNFFCSTLFYLIFH